MLQINIQQRYAQEAESRSLGCANLWPYLNIKTGDSILDLGCGSGLQTSAYAEAVGESGFTAGLDLTPAMIEKARTRKVKYPVDFKVGDIHSLPYPAGFFDWIVSNCVINHSPDKSRVYSEIFRVMKSGGIFIVGDVLAREKLPDSVSSDPAAIADCWGGAIPKKDYMDIIENCGFKDLEILQSRCYIKNGYGLESAVIRGVKP